MSDKKKTPSGTAASPASLEKHLEQEFKPKAHLGATHRFKPVKLIERFDFGARRGGRQPAFVVARLDKAGVSTQPAAAFLESHKPVSS